MHYENMPMQYEISSLVNFFFDIFLIFAQNIDHIMRLYQHIMFKSTII